ncbi:MAG: ABC transporter ATP-binding protein [Rickettsia sp.]|nr:ABC transporter ATP-binding protein [Rickettsia sp.]
MSSIFKRQKKNSFAVEKRFLLKYSSPYITEISISIILVILIAYCSANIIKLISPTIDSIYSIKHPSELKIITFLATKIITLHFLKAISEYFQQFLVKNVSNKILMQIQKDMFNSVLKNDHIKSYPEKIFSHFTNDISLVRSTLSIILGNWIKHSISVIFVTFVMFQMNAKLSLLIILFFPISFYISYQINKELKNVTLNIQDSLNFFTKKINDVFSRIKLIKISSKEEYEYKIFCKSLDELNNLYEKSSKLESSVSPIMEIISGIGTITIIIIGSALILKKSLSPGDVVAFNTAFASIYRPFKTLISMNVHIKIAFTAINNLFEFIKKNNIPNQLNHSKINLATPIIEFKNISLNINFQKILKNINIDFNKKDIYLIVGKSGSGKSSIINLLLGFYEASNGEIKINGQNQNQIDLKNLRSQIDFIAQENMLINDSIFNNITYSSKIFDLEKIQDISKETLLEKIVKKLPKKYDFLVEHKGYNLSGGERQIISITRSIIRNAPILILDEATSSIDFKSERKILNFLIKKRKDKMTIIINHRIKNLKNISKNIFVIKDGQCVGKGSHQDLYQNNIEYKKIFDNEELF